MVAEPIDVRLARLESRLSTLQVKLDAVLVGVFLAIVLQVVIRVFFP
jgi:hypothetical protein